MRTNQAVRSNLLITDNPEKAGPSLAQVVLDEGGQQIILGQLSAALQPLTQDGRFLGLLRKHDSFHLLHDVPLAPGDSGAPLCFGNRVVAIHCGDTATLPGLNLPTTSIRLALWVDSLREF